MQPTTVLLQQQQDAEENICGAPRWCAELTLSLNQAPVDAAVKRVGFPSSSQLSLCGRHHKPTLLQQHGEKSAFICTTHPVPVLLQPLSGVTGDGTPRHTSVRIDWILITLFELLKALCIEPMTSHPRWWWWWW